MTTTTTARVSKPETKFATILSAAPCLDLSWGYRKRFRFEQGTPSTSDSPSPSRSSPSSNPASGDNADGEEKLMHDFHAEVNQPQQTQTETEPKPWNLRTRKHVSSKDDDFMYECHLKEKRAKFSVSLTKKEIEEDFLAMTGVRPARRPKKRVKAVQKQLNAISPGFWLTEITADMYKVNEHPPEVGKRYWGNERVSTK